MPGRPQQRLIEASDAPLRTFKNALASRVVVSALAAHRTTHALATIGTADAQWFSAVGECITPVAQHATVEPDASAGDAGAGDADAASGEAGAAGAAAAAGAGAGAHAESAATESDASTPAAAAKPKMWTAHIVDPATKADKILLSAFMGDFNVSVTLGGVPRRDGSGVVTNPPQAAADQVAIVFINSGAAPLVLNTVQDDGVETHVGLIPARAAQTSVVALSEARNLLWRLRRVPLPRLFRSKVGASGASGAAGAGGDATDSKEADADRARDAHVAHTTATEYSAQCARKSSAQLRGGLPHVLRAGELLLAAKTTGTHVTFLCDWPLQDAMRVRSLVRQISTPFTTHIAKTIGMDMKAIKAADVQRRSKRQRAYMLLRRWAARAVAACAGRVAAAPLTLAAVRMRLPDVSGIDPSLGAAAAAGVADSPGAMTVLARSVDSGGWFALFTGASAQMCAAAAAAFVAEVFVSVRRERAEAKADDDRRGRAKEAAARVARAKARREGAVAAAAADDDAVNKEGLWSRVLAAATSDGVVSACQVALTVAAVSPFRVAYARMASRPPSADGARTGVLATLREVADAGAGRSEWFRGYGWALALAAGSTLAYGMFSKATTAASKAIAERVKDGGDREGDAATAVAKVGAHVLTTAAVAPLALVSARASADTAGGAWDEAGAIRVALMKSPTLATAMGASRGGGGGGGGSGGGDAAPFPGALDSLRDAWNGDDRGQGLFTGAGADVGSLLVASAVQAAAAHYVPKLSEKLVSDLMLAWAELMGGDGDGGGVEFDSGSFGGGGGLSIAPQQAAAAAAAARRAASGGGDEDGGVTV